jgi:hypothetical protein
MKFQILGFSEHNESVVVLKDSGIEHIVQDNWWLTYLPPSTDRMGSSDIHIYSHKHLLYVLLCSLHVIILNVQV